MHHYSQDQHRAAAPLTSLLIASCAVVGLAYWLGATWLANQILGIPGGLWAVAVVFATMRWAERRGVDSWFANFRSRGLSTIEMMCRHLPALIAPIASVPERVANAAQGAKQGWLGNEQDTPDPINYGISNIQEGPRTVPSRARHMPVRVGIDLSDHLATRLMNSPCAIRVDWIPLRNQSLRSQELCRLHRLDAVVHNQGDMIVATPAEVGPLEPAWDDWAAPSNPITYASVFPMRTDAAHISFGETNFSDPIEREIAATLIDAIVQLRHAPLRVATVPGSAAPAHLPMQHLARVIRERAQTHTLLPSYRAACRAVSAWLAVNPVDWSDEDILATLAACAGALSHEPEVLLRAAAIRFVLGEDKAGLEAVVAADVFLHDRSDRASSESQLPFVQSELSMGGDDPLAFGRIAAGLSLCASGASADEIAYMRDDLLDEARFVEWLIGRDDERLVLMQVFRELQRQRDGADSTLFQAA